MQNAYKEESKTEPENVSTGGPTTQKIDPEENIRIDTITSSAGYQKLKPDMKSEITAEAAKKGKTINITNIDIKMGKRENSKSNKYRKYNKNRICSG